MDPNSLPSEKTTDSKTVEKTPDATTTTTEHTESGKPAVEKTTKTVEQNPK